MYLRRKFHSQLLPLLLLTFSWPLLAANTSDPSAIVWAQNATATLTGSAPVNSVSLQAIVTQPLGANQQTGTMTMQASGLSNSQIRISLGSSTITETRSSDSTGPSGQWTDTSGTTHQMAQHNCLTDAAWFFPALSMLSDYANPDLVLKDLGQETHRGVTVEHLRVYRTASALPPAAARHLALMSVSDYYLDSNTALPVAIVFFAHADNDTGKSVPVEVIFAGYHRVSQVMVPFEITKYYNSTVQFHISITNAQIQ